jgi:PAS domain S-box-containing protein
MKAMLARDHDKKPDPSQTDVVVPPLLTAYSTEKMQSVFQAVTCGILVMSLDYVITEANPSATNICGYDNPNELVGRNILEIFAARERDKALLDLSRTPEGHMQRSSDYTLLKKDGSEFLGEVSAGSLWNSSGGPIGLVAVIRNITHRKQTELALRESEERYRSLVNNVMIGIARTSVGPPGRFLELNPAMEQITGYSREELMQMNVEDLYANGEERKQVISRVLASEGLVSNELHFRKKDGSEVDVLDRKIAVRDQEGNVLYIDALVEDITERKKKEKELHDYRHMLRSLVSELWLAQEKERRIIAQDVHDQVGQELAIVNIKLVNILKMCSTLPELSEIAQGLRDIQILVKSVIGKTRTLTFQIVSPVLYEIGLEAALSQLAEDFAQQHPNIRFRFRGSNRVTELTAEINVILFQAVRELLVNAIKHAGPTVVAIRTSVAQKTFKVTVQDNGCGFPPFADATKLMVRSGLGLFAIRERLSQIGGSISIESEPGRGARVTLTIPVAQSRVANGQNTCDVGG